MKQGRGNYVRIEGGEGCGKSYHAKLVQQYFLDKGYPCIFTHEPGGTELGEKIRDILKGFQGNMHKLAELYLFEAPRVELFSELIIPALERGESVVTDRCELSTLAYQGGGDGIDVGIINNLNALSMLGVRPDLSCIIDIDAEKGLAKELEGGRITDKGLEFHKRVNLFYRQLASSSPNIVLIPYIENGQDEMQQQIRKHVRERLGI